MYVLSSTGQRWKMRQCSRQMRSFPYAIPLFETQNVAGSSKRCVMKIAINWQHFLTFLSLPALAGEKISGILVFSE